MSTNRPVTIGLHTYPNACVCMHAEKQISNIIYTMNKRNIESWIKETTSFQLPGLPQLHFIILALKPRIQETMSTLCSLKLSRSSSPSSKPGPGLGWPTPPISIGSAALGCLLLLSGGKRIWCQGCHCAGCPGAVQQASATRNNRVGLMPYPALLMVATRLSTDHVAVYRGEGSASSYLAYFFYFLSPIILFLLCLLWSLLPGCVRKGPIVTE